MPSGGVGLEPTRGESWVASLARADTGRFELELVAEGEADIAESGRCRALFAGLLQNRQELKAALGGAVAQTESDAELVAEGYLREGEGFLERLRGVFAVLLTDARRGVAICARDQLGRHPLFWSEDGAPHPAVRVGEGADRAARRLACGEHRRGRRPPAPALAHRRRDLLRSGSARPARTLASSHGDRARARPVLGPDAAGRTGRLASARRGGALR